MQQGERKTNTTGDGGQPTGKASGLPKSDTGKRRPSRQPEGRKRNVLVHEYLGRGLDTAMTRSELTALLGLERRQVTRAIEAERKAGHPICASVHPPLGYYVAASPEELLAYIESLNHRIREIQQTRDALIEAMETWVSDGDPQTDKERN